MDYDNKGQFIKAAVAYLATLDDVFVDSLPPIIKDNIDLDDVFVDSFPDFFEYNSRYFYT